MIHKARMIGALGSKKGDLGRNLQNVIKNDEQIEYIYKQAEEVKSEMNSSLGAGDLRERQNFLKICPILFGCESLAWSANENRNPGYFTHDHGRIQKTTWQRSRKLVYCQRRFL